MTWATPNAVEFLILTLAAYRLFRFASVDTFEPMVRVREWVTGYRDPREEDTSKQTRQRPEWLADLMACPFCLGAWISLGLVFAWWAWPTVVLAFALPWAVSGAMALVFVKGDPA